MNVTVMGMYAVNNTQKHFSSSSSALLHLSLILFASYFVSVTILTSLTEIAPLIFRNYYCAFHGKCSVLQRSRTCIILGFNK
jgi:hypothetical protein